MGISLDDYYADRLEQDRIAYQWAEHIAAQTGRAPGDVWQEWREEAYREQAAAPGGLNTAGIERANQAVIRRAYKLWQKHMLDAELAAIRQRQQGE